MRIGMGFAARAIAACALVILVGEIHGQSTQPIVARRVSIHAVATLKQGARLDELADTECEEDAECIAGFGMAGPGETIYFYDYGRKNIKVLATAPGYAGQRLLNAIPGVDLTPDDGTILHDGTIYLLVDRWGNRLPVDVERYVIYVRRPEDTEWRELPPLIDSGFGREADGINIHNSVYIGSNSQDDVFAYDTHGTYLQVATVHGALEATARRPLSPAVAGLGPMKCSQGCAMVHVPVWNASPRPLLEFTSIGVDAAGRLYSLMLHSDDEMTIQRHDPSGDVLDAVVLPRLPSEKMFLGKGRVIVLASGRIMELQVDRKGLAIHEIRF